MTVGSFTTGVASCGVYYATSWSGQDDPEKVRPNPYTKSWDSIRQTKSVRLVSVSENCATSTRTPACYCNCGAFPADPTWTSTDQAFLIGKLSNAIQNTDFDVGVALAEGRETTQMVLSYLKTIRRAVTRLKRRDVFFHESLGISRDSRHVNLRMIHDDTLSGNLANAWLGTAYGVVPLMNDVFALVNEFKGLTTLRSLTVRASHFKGSNFNPSGSPSKYTCEGISSVRASYKYTLREAPSYARQLGLLNPGAIIWEATPLSFCADWVLPVGSYLNALGTLSEMTGTWELSILKRMTGKLSAILDPKYCAAGFTSFRNRGSFTRTVGSTPLSVPLPRLRGVDNLVHYVTMASLIRQRSSAVASLLNSLTNSGKKHHSL